MSKLIGKKVIVRGTNAGVFFGTLESKDKDYVCLENARKLFYWDGAGAVEGISVQGTTKPENCKFTVFVPSIEIEGVCQVLPCSDEAAKIIESVKEWRL